MQYLHELLAFLAIPFAVNGVTRITTPNYKAVNFAKARNKRYETQWIRH